MSSADQQRQPGFVLSQISRFWQALGPLQVSRLTWDGRASEQLFRRPDDERFGSLIELWNHCHTLKQRSEISCQPAGDLCPNIGKGLLALPDGRSFNLNDWSFSQLCGLASIRKKDLRALSPQQGDELLRQGLLRLRSSVEVLATGDTARSVRPANHDLLWDADVLTMVREFATDFRSPPVGFNGATGLYAGQQDMFCFLIDPLGWADIKGQAFAPGFFVWNSEVGSRPAGISTFWFQAVCQNHIVWYSTEMQEFVCDNVLNADDAINQLRRRIEILIEKRDQRRDGFAKVIARAMSTRLGSDREEVERILEQINIDRHVAAQAIASARRQGGFTIFSVVDALTRANRELMNAAQRTQADRQAAQLLSFVGERPGPRRAVNTLTDPAPVLCRR